MSNFDDLKYVDYVIRFVNKSDRTNELMLVSLNIMKENPTLTIREVINKSLDSLDISIDNDIKQVNQDNIKMQIIINKDGNRRLSSFSENKVKEIEETNQWCYVINKLLDDNI